ncbi:MAG: hypothetical protein KDI61_03920 [Alphaproteobacteria bacterium]|nr:hypothetical protein [Alphaproteobacteria bacterium]
MLVIDGAKALHPSLVAVLIKLCAEINIVLLFARDPDSLQLLRTSLIARRLSKPDFSQKNVILVGVEPAFQHGFGNIMLVNAKNSRLMSHDFRGNLANLIACKTLCVQIEPQTFCNRTDQRLLRRIGVVGVQERFRADAVAVQKIDINGLVKETVANGVFPWRIGSGRGIGIGSAR